MNYRIGFGLLASAVIAFVGCSGGGSGTSAVPKASVPTAVASAVAPAITTRVMDIGFAGTSALSAGRQVKALSGTPVTVTYHDKTVATGTLDANGHATITFTADVPRGATVVVTAGSVKATVVLADADDGTAVTVTVKPDGTLTVSAQPEHPGNGASPSASPSPGSGTSTIDEDKDGNPTAVATTTNAFPSNLPVMVTATCSSLTIAPNGPTLSHVEIELRSQDGEDEAGLRFKFEGALTSALTIPIPSGTLRLRIRIFGANGQTTLDIKGPITANTAGTAASPCPSNAPSAAPSASASASPSAKPSESAAPSATPSASPTPI